MPKMHIQINGSGRGSKIILPEGKSMRMEGLSYLGLFDLRIKGSNAPEGVVAIKGIERFLMDNCQIVPGHQGSTGTASAGTTPIETASMSTALSIREGEGEMIITNSRIDGVLCLYEGRPTEMVFSTHDMERLKKRVALLMHRVRRGVLVIRGNVIGRIAVGESMVQMIRNLWHTAGSLPKNRGDVRMIFLTNNAIASGRTSSLRHISHCPPTASIGC
jgi:hypothetical protein